MRITTITGGVVSMPRDLSSCSEVVLSGKVAGVSSGVCSAVAGCDCAGL